MTPSRTAPNPSAANRTVAVFGGTGKTGRHVVEQALAAGHRVHVLARTPSKLDLQHDRLRVVKGDVRVGRVGVNTGPRIARAGMARFMLQQLDDPAHVRASPVISN